MSKKSLQLSCVLAGPLMTSDTQQLGFLANFLSCSIIYHCSSDTCYAKYIKTLLFGKVCLFGSACCYILFDSYYNCRKNCLFDSFKTVAKTFYSIVITSAVKTLYLTVITTVTKIVYSTVVTSVGETVSSTVVSSVTKTRYWTVVTGVEVLLKLSIRQLLHVS